MLTTLATVKSRLSIPDTDPQFDALLTAAITAVSARFDKETHRTLARTENFTQEFDPADTEILATCYPVETVTEFQLKTSESEGWQELQPAPDHLIRSACIISLPSPISYLPSSPSLARVTYTGGYLPPGDTVQPSIFNFQLPADLESAAIEQVAFWFQTRDKLGLKTLWIHEGNYHQFATLDLLPSVQAVLKKYERWTL